MSQKNDKIKILKYYIQQIFYIEQFHIIQHNHHSL